MNGHTPQQQPSPQADVPPEVLARQYTEELEALQLVAQRRRPDHRDPAARRQHWTLHDRMTI